MSLSKPYVSGRHTSVAVFDVVWFSDPSSYPVAIAAFKEVAKKWIFQYERCPTTGNTHLQGVISLKERSYSSGAPIAAKLNYLDMNGVSCRRASTNGLQALNSYCMKEESRIAGPWADKPIYLGEDVRVIQDSPHPFQKALLDIVTQPPDDRTIHWIHEGNGCVGKSKLIKYLVYKKIAVPVPFGTATQIKTFCFNFGQSRNCYVINMPRTRGKAEHMEDLISSLESLKDGIIVSGMYGKSQIAIFNPPHILVFANRSPPFKMMSPDRWKVWGINADKELVGIGEEVDPPRVSESLTDHLMDRQLYNPDTMF